MARATRSGRPRAVPIHLCETLLPRKAIIGALFIGAVLIAGEVAALCMIKGDGSSNLTEFLAASSFTYLAGSHTPK